MKTETWTLSGAALWLARTGDVEQSEWQALYDRMDPARQEHCDRYRREEDRRACVLADALARQALCQGTSLAPEAVVFARTEKGKPYALDLPRHFSVSHSGSLVLCAVAEFSVGADVQRRRRVSEPLKRRMARAGYRGECEEDFFAWWVRQEAAGKLAGTGLSLGPLGPGLEFRFGELEEADGQYFYCVCAKKGAFL